MTVERGNTENRQEPIENLMFREFNGHRIATAVCDTGTRDIVVFCHGFQGTSIGPSRFFVRAARDLATAGVSSLRFDQFGCGNSQGDFRDSSFDNWVQTTRAIVQHYLDAGYRVALFGQSMGAATAIVVASELDVVATVAWVPDPNVDKPSPSSTGFAEEGGQLVQNRYWEEAHVAKVAERLRLVGSPLYIVQCTDDFYVDEMNRRAIAENAQPHHVVDTFDGYSHSSWTYDQATDIIGRSVSFLSKVFEGRG